MGKGSSNLMECKMEMEDQVIKRNQALKTSADIIVKKFTHYAANEENKQAVLTRLDDMLSGFSDREKYMIMAYVFMKLA